SVVMPDEFFEVAGPDRPVRFSPTDLSQFVRLEQCERYLRIRLFEHRSGQRFFYDYGVRPQPIPELLTRSGRRFEERVESAVGLRFPAVNFARDWKGAGNRPADNERLAEAARGLSPGEALCLFQARLQVDLGARSAGPRWRLTGDADLLR